MRNYYTSLSFRPLNTGLSGEACSVSASDERPYANPTEFLYGHPFPVVSFPKVQNTGPNFQDAQFASIGQPTAGAIK